MEPEVRAALAAIEKRQERIVAFLEWLEWVVRGLGFGGDSKVDDKSTWKRRR